MGNQPTTFSKLMFLFFVFLITQGITMKTSSIKLYWVQGAANTSLFRLWCNQAHIKPDHQSTHTQDLMSLQIFFFFFSIGLLAACKSFQFDY